MLRALIVAALLAAPAEQLGRSYEGRPIHVVHVAGDGPRILVVGCIHGDECEGIEVTQAARALAASADLWLVHQLNPDGYARRSRTNARGVDLNRDFLAATQRETRIARKLILRLRPDVTIWFHQPQAVVRAWGPSRAIARRYARLAGVPYRRWEWPPGSASRWQNGLGQISFVVELGRASWRTRWRGATRERRAAAGVSRFGAVFWLDNGAEMELEELLEDGPVLLLFYLFDWSPT